MTFFAGLLLIGFGLRLWLAAFGGIHPDEAYYWTWSLAPSLGYYDHPPAIAWIISASRWIVERLVGEEMARESAAFVAQLSLRALPMFLASVLTPFFLGRAIEVAQKGALRITQMFVLLSLPLFVWGPFLVTPDVPFLTAWSWVLLQSLRLRSASLPAGEKTPFRPGLAVGIGIGLAFMAYSKYTAILAAFLLIVTGAGLANVAVAGGVALALVTPYFVWAWGDGRAEGAGIVFQLQNGFGDLLRAPNWKSVGDLCLSQIILWTPFLFLGALLRPAMPGRCRMSGRLWTWSFVPLLFFSLGALRRRAEANWPLAGALAATVASLSGAYMRPLRLWATIFVSWGLSLGFFLVIVEGPKLARPLRNFSPRLAERLERPSKLEDFRDWDNLHAFLSEAMRADERPILVESYQLLSVLLFQDAIASPEIRLGDRLRIWTEGSRVSEFHRRQGQVEAPASYWLVLMPSRELEPTNCVLRQTVYKGSSFPTAFRVLSCTR